MIRSRFEGVGSVGPRVERLARLCHQAPITGCEDAVLRNIHGGHESVQDDATCL